MNKGKEKEEGVSQGVCGAEIDGRQYAQRMNKDRGMGTCHGVGNKEN
jgi:hypothetical protein